MCHDPFAGGGCVVNLVNVRVLPMLMPGITNQGNADQGPPELNQSVADNGTA